MMSSNLPPPLVHGDVNQPLVLFAAVVARANQQPARARTRFLSQDELLQRFGTYTDRHSLRDAEKVRDLKPRGPFPLALPADM